MELEVKGNVSAEGGKKGSIELDVEAADIVGGPVRGVLSEVDRLQKNLVEALDVVFDATFTSDMVRIRGMLYDLRNLIDRSRVRR